MRGNQPPSPAGLETGFDAPPVHDEAAGAWGAGCLDAVSPTDGRLPTFPQVAHTLDTTPYQTVQLYHPNSSVPDLAPNLGVLQVANLLPGDISSSAESSRASSVLSMVRMPPDCGTPYERMSGERPRFLAVQADVLPLPWSPLHMRDKRAEAQRPKSTSSISEKSLEPLPYPGDAPSSSVASSSWASSIRTNIVNVLNAVVRAPVAAHSAVDNLTNLPRRRPRSGDVGQQHGADMLSREASTYSTRSDFKNALPPASEWTSIPLEDDPHEVPHAVAETPNGDGLVSYSQQKHRLDIIEEYYSLGALEDSPQLSGEPRLPDIPQMSDSPSRSSLAIVCEERAQRKSTKYKKGSTRKKTRASRRPVVVARASSSFYSVGSDMSRQSSASSQHLTAAEALAKRVLRERRRRVLEMAHVR